MKKTILIVTETFRASDTGQRKENFCRALEQYIRSRLERRQIL